jgi:hypothetical protein
MVLGARVGVHEKAAGPALSRGLDVVLKEF